MTLTLRPFQREAVAAVYDYLSNNADNPCVVVPTGAGKTPIIAQICRDIVGQWKGRVLVLAHVRELLQQSVAEIQTLAPELMMRIGVYSAGLKSRDAHTDIVVAGIQSVHSRACELGPFDVILVDEAHLLPPSGEGMYRSFIADAKVVNPNVRVVGLTATPFRLGSGEICAPENILNTVCYEIGVRECIALGYLCPLVSKAGATLADLSEVHTRAGDFVESEVAEAMDTERLVQAACNEIVGYTRERKSCLIFCTNLKHADHVLRTLRDGHKLVADIITGETLHRELILNEFKAGTLPYLVNVNVLTTGFNAKNIDCVVLLRPTLSPGLYYQMVGRGFRLHPSKSDCLVLDYGGNILRHGPVDDIVVETPRARSAGAAGREAKPDAAKPCPQCNALISLGYGICPHCDYVFPKKKSAHDEQASDAPILSTEIKDDEHEVTKTTYQVWYKRGATPGTLPTMRVTYECGIGEDYSEFIAIQHLQLTFGRANAEDWWANRTNVPYPLTVEDAVKLAQAGALRETRKIWTRKIKGEKYPKVVRWDVSEEKPTWSPDEVDGALAAAEPAENLGQLTPADYKEFSAVSWDDGKDDGDGVPF